MSILRERGAELGRGGIQFKRLQEPPKLSSNAGFFIMHEGQKFTLEEFRSAEIVDTTSPVNPLAESLTYPLSRAARR